MTLSLIKSPLINQKPNNKFSDEQQARLKFLDEHQQTGSVISTEFQLKKYVVLLTDTLVHKKYLC